MIEWQPASVNFSPFNSISLIQSHHSLYRIIWEKAITFLIISLSSSLSLFLVAFLYRSLFQCLSLIVVSCIFITFNAMVALIFVFVPFDCILINDMNMNSACDWVRIIVFHSHTHTQTQKKSIEMSIYVRFESCSANSRFCSNISPLYYLSRVSCVSFATIDTSYTKALFMLCSLQSPHRYVFYLYFFRSFVRLLLYLFHCFIHECEFKRLHFISSNQQSIC